MGINFRIFAFPRLNISVSRVQTFVGLAAGILSITGALVAFIKPVPDKAELVAVVQGRQNRKGCVRCDDRDPNTAGCRHYNTKAELVRNGAIHVR